MKITIEAGVLTTMDNVGSVAVHHFVDLGDPEETYHLQIKLTDEGLIIDKYDADNDMCIGTAGYTIDELAELTH
jgi:hypothetical protein